MSDDLSREGLEAATSAVEHQHGEEIRRYLEGTQPANQWRPEQYAEAAVRAYLSASRSPRDLEAVAKELRAYGRDLRRWPERQPSAEVWFSLADRIEAALPHLVSGPVLPEGQEETDG